MADQVLTLKQIYAALTSMLPQTHAIQHYNEKARNISDKLIELLRVLEDNYKYNFSLNLQYTAEITSAAHTDVKSWKEAIFKYLHSAMQYIVMSFVRDRDPDAINYYIDYNDKTLNKAANIEQLLSTISEITDGVFNSKSELDKLVIDATYEKNEITALLSNVKVTETKVSTLNETITELSNKSALLEGIKNFEELAKSYKISSRWWAGFAVLVAGSLILFASHKLLDYSKFTSIASSISCMHFDGYDRDTVSTTLYIAFAKHMAANFLIVSILIYTLTVAIKNYRANMHNSVVCRHKAAAIESSKKLVNNTTGPDIEQFILASAANAIFAHQNTGYNDKEEPSEMNKISTLTKLLDSVKPLHS